MGTTTSANPSDGMATLKARIAATIAAFPGLPDRWKAMKKIKWRMVCPTLGMWAAIENPVMHKYARDYLASAWKVPTFTQSIQPWQYGHGETKRTCLWLRNLPLLQPTHRKGDLFCAEEPKERVQRVHRMAPGPNRSKERSRFFPGVSKAMAEQWSNFILNK